MQRKISILSFLFIMALFSAPRVLICQTNQAFINNERYLSEILSRMNDTLRLTETEKNSIEKVHALMAIQKMQAWQNKQDTVFIRNKLNSIEKSRDSLYREALPSEKFQKYLQLKRYILVGPNN
jgi:predicted choloylglycine hydrolase